MARRTQTFFRFPSTGGLNTAVDEGAIPPDDLQVADNIQFTTSGSRIRREGFSYFDSDMPTILARSSSGTTRTLIFDQSVNTASDDLLVSGEAIAITTDGGTGDVLEYVDTSTVASVATTTPSDQNFTDGDVDTANDQININSHGFYTGMAFQLTSSGTLPGGLETGSTYYIIEVDSDNIQIASSLANARAGTAIDITSASGGGTHTVDVTAVSNNTITYGGSSALTESQTSTTTLSITRNWKFLGLEDFWYVASGTKTQVLIGVSDEVKFYKYDSDGGRKEITKNAGATAIQSGVKEVHFSSLANKLIISFNGDTTPKKFEPVTSTTEWYDLGGSPPNFRISRPHLGRLFTDDKDNPDRLHFSAPGNVETWKGSGDSAAIDIFPNDGDPAGITAISPPFRSRLFVSKKTKIVELQNFTPETFRLVTFTEGLGMISHNGIASIDLDDVYFVSDKGVHSLSTTASHGDFQGAFKSAKIQPSFNDFQSSRLKYTSTEYLPQLNSIALNVSNEDSSTHDELWLYNVPLGLWYRWPGQSAEALSSRLVDERERKFVFGTDDGRVVQAQNGTRTDFDSTGISSRIKTGAIYPGNNPLEVNMFKRIFLYFKPDGDFTFTITATVDNYESQVKTITTSPSLDTLGETFILGSSELGSVGVLAPVSVPIEGVGRGITLEITASGTEEVIENYGYGIEFEPADINQETI